MKKFSKILSVALLVALVLSLGVSSAFAAAGDETITIRVNTTAQTQADQNATMETYVAYKVFDVVKSGSGANISYNYTISTTDDFYAAVSGTGSAAGYFVLTPTSDANVFTVSVKDAYNNEEGAKAIAATLLAYASANSIQGTSFGGTTEVPSLETTPGYYLISGSNTENLILATTDIDITEKAEYPTIVKTLADSIYNIGDTVTYTITVHVPKTAVVGEYMYVTDTMDTHLALKTAPTTTFTGASLVELDATDDAKYVQSDATWQRKFVILSTMLDNDVVITYTAELLIADSVDPTSLTEAGVRYANETYLDYFEYETPKSKVYVSTLKFDVTKDFAGSTDTELEATFEVHKGSATGDVVSFVAGENKYTVADSNATDKVTTITLKKGVQVNILGLDEGTYYLVEKTTGTGYNVLEKPVILTLSANKNDSTSADPVTTSATLDTGSDALASLTDGTVSFTIMNNKGTVLPSTGGIGTTIFYAVGGILVLAAIVLLITKKRMSD